jgi:Flp pilus assembly protein protease CpaA
MLSLALLAVLSLAGAYYDYRERRIPNALTQSALAAALVLALATGAPAFYYALVVIAFLFSLALYAVGAWAGGDAKFFTAALALAGLSRVPSQAGDLSYLLLLALVFILAAALTAVAAVALRRERVWRARATFYGAFLASVKDAVGGALLGGLVHALGFFVFSWHLDGIAGSCAAGAAGVFAASLVLRAAFFLRGALARRVELHGIREGVVPAQTLYLDSRGALREWTLRDLLRSAFAGRTRFSPRGRVLCDSRRARGLTAGEARELKRVFKARGVKFLLCREAMPFAPQVGAAAFALAVLRVLALV